MITCCHYLDAFDSSSDLRSGRPPRSARWGAHANHPAKTRYFKPLRYIARALISASLSLTATSCITALSLVRSRLLNSLS